MFDCPVASHMPTWIRWAGIASRFHCQLLYHGWCFRCTNGERRSKLLLPTRIGWRYDSWTWTENMLRLIWKRPGRKSRNLIAQNWWSVNEEGHDDESHVPFAISDKCLCRRCEVAVGVLMQELQLPEHGMQCGVGLWDEHSNSSAVIECEAGSHQCDHWQH